MKTSRRDFMLTAAGCSLGAAATADADSSQSAEVDRPRAGVVVVPEREVPVLAEADVLVCGGGPAGIAAACSAARHGAKVVLLERWPSVGGMATNALVNIWHTSDRTKQVIYGLVQETIERAGDFIRRMAHYPTRPETHEFDPEGMRIVFHTMLEESGVRTLCNLMAVESVRDGDRLQGVLVDTKTGRKALLGRIVVDATGDGDVAANAGTAFDFGRQSDGLVQGMTMMFRLLGVKADSVRAHPEDAERVFALMRDLCDRGQFPPFLDAASRSYLRSPRSPVVSYNMCPVSGNPLDEEELTRISVRARRQVMEYVTLWRREMPGFEDAQVSQMGFSLGIRESRRIRGRKTLDASMVVQAKKQPDAIGHGFWMVDIHDPKGSGHTTWVDQKPETMPPAGDSYHIPLGMCLSPQFANLAVVGRCASATHEGLASVRIQTHCMIMGQGVGTCAALALQGGTDMNKVDIRMLQSTLRDDGVYLKDVPQVG
ncbi:MAG: FAD-dependent oxidoreductase [Pirellulaceae bacterium]